MPSSPLLKRVKYVVPGRALMGPHPRLWISCQLTEDQQRCRCVIPASAGITAALWLLRLCKFPGPSLFPSLVLWSFCRFNELVRIFPSIPTLLKFPILGICGLRPSCPHWRTALVQPHATRWPHYCSFQSGYLFLGALLPQFTSVYSPLGGVMCYLLLPAETHEGQRRETKPFWCCWKGFHEDRMPGLKPG